MIMARVVIIRSMCTNVWAQSCMGTNVSEHKHAWSQICLVINVSEHKHVWVQTCLGTTVSGYRRVGTIVWGIKQVWAQSCGLQHPQSAIISSYLRVVISGLTGLKHLISQLWGRHFAPLITELMREL